MGATGTQSLTSDVTIENEARTGKQCVLCSFRLPVILGEEKLQEILENVESRG